MNFPPLILRTLPDTSSLYSCVFRDITHVAWVTHHSQEKPPESHMTKRRSHLSHTWLTGHFEEEVLGWGSVGNEAHTLPVMNCMPWFLFLTSLWTQKTLQKFMFHVLKTNFAISLNSSKLRHIRNLKNTFFCLFKVPKHILQLPSNEC